MREKYKKNLEKIQKNMVRLKKAQNRIRGIKITEPVTHQEGKRIIKIFYKYFKKNLYQPSVPKLNCFSCDFGRLLYVPRC